LYESWYVLLKDALDNGLIKPKHVVLLMYIFNCGGDGFYDCLLYNHPRMLKYRLPAIILITFFCKVNTFLLLDELPQKIIPYFITE
jgi:hypothetical protein